MSHFLITLSMYNIEYIWSARVYQDAFKTGHQKEIKGTLKNKSLRPWLLSAISLIIIIAFVRYLYNNADKYYELLSISKIAVLMLFLISFAFPLLNGMQNTYLYRDLGLKGFSYRDGFLITAASTLANQLPIPGGILSRAYYLKRRHDLSYAKYTSSTIALFFCYLAVNGLIGIATLLYLFFIDGIAIPSALLIAFTMMTACISVFRLPFQRIRMPEWLRQRVQQAIDGWMLISQNPGLLFRLTILQVALVILLSLRYWISFHMLSQNVTLGQTLLLASASILTQLVSIAPGGLGVREVIVASIATVFGFDIGISIVAVGLDRLVTTVVIMLTGWVSTVILGKQISNTAEESA